MRFLRKFNENLEISDIEQVIEHVEYCFYDLIDLGFKIEVTPLHTVATKNSKSLYTGVAFRQEIKNWNIDNFDTVKIKIYFEGKDYDNGGGFNIKINKPFTPEYKDDILYCLERAKEYLTRHWTNCEVTTVEKEKPVTIQKVINTGSNYNADWWWSDHSFYSMTFWLEKAK